MSARVFLKRACTSFLIATSVFIFTGCAARHPAPITDPAEARAAADSALVNLSAGETQAAIASLDRVIASGKAQDSDYTRRAAAYGALGQYTQALADADAAIKMRPDAWRTYFQRSIFNQKLGKLDAAVEDLDRAIALNGEDTSLLRRRGYLVLVAGRFKDAVAAYDRLGQVEENSLAAATGRGVALYVDGDWRAAAREFDKLLTEIPGDAITALWFVKASLRAPYPINWERFEGVRGDDPEWRLVDALGADEGLDNVLQTLAALAATRARKGITPCERALFLGEWRMIRLQGEGAIADFERAQKACPKDSIERTQAQTELSRLIQTPPAG